MLVVLMYGNVFLFVCLSIFAKHAFDNPQALADADTPLSEALADQAQRDAKSESAKTK